MWEWLRHFFLYLLLWIVHLDIYIYPYFHTFEIMGIKLKFFNTIFFIPQLTICYLQMFCFMRHLYYVINFHWYWFYPAFKNTFVLGWTYCTHGKHSIKFSYRPFCISSHQILTKAIFSIYTHTINIFLCLYVCLNILYWCGKHDLPLLLVWLCADIIIITYPLPYIKKMHIADLAS